MAIRMNFRGKTRGTPGRPPSFVRPAVRPVTVKGTRIRAEIADNPLWKFLGLMFRKRLERGTGMLFCFRRPGRHAIHMMNVRFPLDILFIGSDGRIAHIHRATPGEWGFRPATPVCHVLEVEAGFCRRHRVRVGDRCVLPRHPARS